MATKSRTHSIVINNKGITALNRSHANSKGIVHIKAIFRNAKKSVIIQIGKFNIINFANIINSTKSLCFRVINRSSDYNTLEKNSNFRKVVAIYRTRNCAAKAGLHKKRIPKNTAKPQFERLPKNVQLSMPRVRS